MTAIANTWMASSCRGTRRGSFPDASLSGRGDPVQRRSRDLQERIDDYLAFGVAFVWVIDPRRRAGIVHTAAGSWEARDGVLRTRSPNIDLPFDELW